MLRDWNIVSFAPPRDRDDPREDYRTPLLRPLGFRASDWPHFPTGFIFRHRAAKESPVDSIHQSYEIHHGLGSGAFATVVKALHLTERKWYAIKCFPGERVQQFLSRPSRRAKMIESAWKHLEREMGVLKLSDLALPFFTMRSMIRRDTYTADRNEVNTPIPSVMAKFCTGPVPKKPRITAIISVVTFESKMAEKARA